jgi:hypothetical protein
MHLRLSACLLLSGLVACSGSNDDLGTTPGSILNTPGTTGGAQSAAIAPTPSGAGNGGTTSGTLSTPTGTGGTITGGLAEPSATAGTNSAGAAGNGLPCDVASILKDRCQTCHGDPLASGPMKLISWADLQADSSAKPGNKVAARVKARIADAKLPMPPTGRSPLTEQEKQILNAYIDAGAKQSQVACAATPEKPSSGSTAGRTGDRNVLPPDSDCDYMQELRAHGAQNAGDSAPFEPPNGTDHYEIFYFTPKWSEKVHVIRIDPIIDNGAVLHHWLLYMEENGNNAEGSHRSDIGLQSPDSQLLSGWAPGNMSVPLGTDIGLQTIAGPNTRFGIELHYNTTGNPPNRKDRSGARLCATKKLRAHEASVHWLGTQLIASFGLGGMVEASGSCSVQQESHIIAHSPHMHTMGRYMKTMLNRGSQQIKITDQPFAFLDQQIFPVDDPSGEIIAKPGDVIDTVCTYDGSGLFTFGPNTDQEMCYNFVVAWPAGSLSNGAAGVVGGKNTCIDLL